MGIAETFKYLPFQLAVLISSDMRTLWPIKDNSLYSCIQDIALIRCANYSFGNQDSCR